MLTPNQIKARYAARREQQHKQNHLYEPTPPVAEHLQKALADAARKRGITDKATLDMFATVGAMFDKLIADDGQLHVRIKKLEKHRGNTSSR